MTMAAFNSTSKALTVIIIVIEKNFGQARDTVT